MSKAHPKLEQGENKSVEEGGYIYIYILIYIYLKTIFPSCVTFNSAPSPNPPCNHEGAPGARESSSSDSTTPGMEFASAERQELLADMAPRRQSMWTKRVELGKGRWTWPKGIFSAQIGVGVALVDAYRWGELVSWLDCRGGTHS